jgi:two-component system, response regulator
MKTGTVDILLIEDQINDAELTIRALKKDELVKNVLHISSGEEALQYIFCQGPYQNRNDQDMPKLILLDLKMPRIDGLQVLRQVKNCDWAKVIPVVVLSSSKEDKDIMESYKLGANSYFVKPVDYEAFLQAIASLCLYWLQLNQPAPASLKPV